MKNANNKATTRNIVTPRNGCYSLHSWGASVKALYRKGREKVPMITPNSPFYALFLPVEAHEPVNGYKAILERSFTLKRLKIEKEPIRRG